MAVFVRCCSCDTQHMGVIASHICMEYTQSASITAVEACHKKSDWSHSFRQNVLHIHKRGRLFSFLSTDPVLVLFSGACALCWAFLRAAVMACLGIYCTFEVGSDAGIISWRPPHELVQEVRRRQLWSCPAGGLYLLLTGAQSDITQGGREGEREQIQRERGKEKREREGGFRKRQKCVRGKNEKENYQVSHQQNKISSSGNEGEKWWLDVLPQLATKSLSASHHVSGLLWLLDANYRAAEQTRR